MKTEFALSRSVVILAFLVLIITAFFSKGHHHPDEHYQILEFASFHLGNSSADQLPWEYTEQMRPTIQVYLAAAVMKVVQLFGGSPFTVTLVLRLLSALLSFFSITLIISAFRNKFQSKPALQTLVFCSFFLWFIVYHNVRFSSENWSGTLFLIGLAVYLLDFKKSVIRLGIVGLVFGLAFLFRYQLVFMIGGFGLWVLIFGKLKWSELLSGLLAFVTIVFIGFCLDSSFYGEPVSTFYNYIYQNLVEGKAASFGVEPFWWYFSDAFLKGIPPFSLVFIGALLFLIVKRPKGILSWSVLPFLLVHCVIAHKETRFLVPIYFLIPLIVAYAMEILNIDYRKVLEGVKGVKVLKKLFVYLHIPILLVVMFKSADSSVGLYKAVYEQSDHVVLYGINKSPYDGQDLNSMNFYKPKEFEYRSVESLNEIQPEDSEVLFVAKERELFEEAEKLGWSEVYRSIPAWLKMFNFNEWMERTPQWRLYRIESPG